MPITRRFIMKILFEFKVREKEKNTLYIVFPLAINAYMLQHVVISLWSYYRAQSCKELNRETISVLCTHQLNSVITSHHLYESDFTVSINPLSLLLEGCSILIYFLIVLVGNKNDLDANREVSYHEASLFAQENSYKDILNPP